MVWYFETRNYGTNRSTICQNYHVVLVCNFPDDSYAMNKCLKKDMQWINVWRKMPSDNKRNRYHIWRKSQSYAAQNWSEYICQVNWLCVWNLMWCPFSQLKNDASILKFDFPVMERCNNITKSVFLFNLICAANINGIFDEKSADKLITSTVAKDKLH